MKILPVNFLIPDVHAIRDGRRVQVRRPSGLLSGCVAGDRLWIREPFRLPATLDDRAPTAALASRDQRIWYAADGPAPPAFGRTRFAREMPRAAHRAHLVVTFARDTKLQAMSADDARAEGFADVDDFRRAWDDQALASGGRSITGDRIAWADNPPVTVLGFEFLDVPVTQLRSAA